MTAERSVGLVIHIKHKHKSNNMHDNIMMPSSSSLIHPDVNIMVQ